MEKQAINEGFVEQLRGAETVERSQLPSRVVLDSSLNEFQYQTVTHLREKSDRLLRKSALAQFTKEQFKVGAKVAGWAALIGAITYGGLEMNKAMLTEVETPESILFRQLGLLYSAIKEEKSKREEIIDEILLTLEETN